MSLTASPPPAPPPPIQPVRSVVSPLLPVVLPLVIAAIGLSWLFAHVFPAGPAEDAPAIRFTDVTAEAGLMFTHRQGGADAPTTLAGAVVVLDFNQDGAPDLFFVNGAPWPWEESLEKRLGRNSALLRNDGRGHFIDVTAPAGLNVEMQGMAATAGDFDNDGLTDLFVTCVGPNHLFRNLGQGRFEDVTEEAGIGGEENTWSSGAAWIDFDRDGRLDLVVLHYARWPREVGLAQAFAIANIGRSYGAPTGFVSAFPSVYRNLGEGRFALVPDSAGLRDLDRETSRPTAQPLAIAPLDANGDGHLDLLITYQNSGPALFLSLPGGTFEKHAARADRQEGSAASLASASALPMGANFQTDLRAQILPPLALAPAARTADELPLALAGKLGVALADFNLDGRTEIFSGEGAAELHLNKFEPGRDFARPPAVMYHKGDAWPAVTWDAANPWVTPLAIRGAAVADFDGDGDSDVVIAQNNAGPILLRNDQRLDWPWLQLRLIATHSHSEAAGARVEVHTPRRVLQQTVGPALGFMAQSDSTLTFGLGDDTRVRKIVIRWPSGRIQELRPTALKQTLVVREP
ncbi:MAG TPA: CRTAC1 family protein [Opitutaceae bacterium]|nr:CRTAC1 family protein [Opitutaceae bacterium]